MATQPKNVTKLVSITPRQAAFIENAHYNLSELVQDMIDEKIVEEEAYWNAPWIKDDVRKAKDLLEEAGMLKDGRIIKKIPVAELEGEGSA